MLRVQCDKSERTFDEQHKTHINWIETERWRKIMMMTEKKRRKEFTHTQIAYINKSHRNRQFNHPMIRHDQPILSITLIPHHNFSSQMRNTITKTNKTKKKNRFAITAIHNTHKKTNNVSKTRKQSISFAFIHIFRCLS